MKRTVAGRPNKLRRRNPRSICRGEESFCEEQGFHLIAGIDEVGRGCLAGPVVAAAVIMDGEKTSGWSREVRDSKMLSLEQRLKVIPLIYENALTIGTGVVDSTVIDAHGMTYAVREAMRLAVEKLQPQPGYLLIDYMTIPDLALPQKGVPDGDTLCFSIACASIVAKVYRDNLMLDLDRFFPGYGFSQNKGYGTHDHVVNLKKLGPCPAHRRLFGPVKNLAQLSLDDMLTLSRELEESETQIDG
jgi:ribonuclease HII